MKMVWGVITRTLGYGGRPDGEWLVECATLDPDSAKHLYDHLVAFDSSKQAVFVIAINTNEMHVIAVKHISGIMEENMVRQNAIESNAKQVFLFKADDLAPF